MKNNLMILLMMVISFNVYSAKAETSDSDYQGPFHWESFHKYMEERQREDHIKGVSYVISGILATVGGIAGNSNSEDSPSRAVYVIAQSVGVAAIGHGANVFWNGNEYNSFFYAVEGVSLTPGQKAALLQRFLEKEKEERRQFRWIKIATHSFIAIMNLYSATQEENREVRNVLNFLAGTNAIISLSYTF